MCNTALIGSMSRFLALSRIALGRRTDANSQWREPRRPIIALFEVDVIPQRRHRLNTRRWQPRVQRQTI